MNCQFASKRIVAIQAFIFRILLYFCCIFLIYKQTNQMHPNPPPMRKSYSYKFQETHNMLSPPTKLCLSQSPHPQNSQQISHTIRQMQGKIENFENLMKIKSQNEVFLSGESSPKLKFDYKPQYKTQLGISQQDSFIRNQEPNGLAHNSIFKKYESTNNLRNTTHFNSVYQNKLSGYGEMKRIDDSKNVSSAINKTQDSLTAIPSNQYFKIYDENSAQRSGSFIKREVSKTPNKTQPNNHTSHLSKTPTKLTKIIFENQTKHYNFEDKKIFKSLNEIIENKNKQKPVLKDSQVKKYSKTINGFQIGKVLGKGKFGEVFLSRHQKLGYLVAMKKIEKNKVIEYKMVDQFAKQIRLHSCLDHPNIVKFYGCFQEKNDIYLVMEYMNGGTLFDYLNKVNALTVKETVQYLRGIIEALTYMHEKSIAHRDIKPQNIVISSEGVAKLCDFGWSAIVECPRNTYCGTFSYAPPQILERKNYDASVDIWSIGVLTYELLTGRQLFEGQKRNIVMEKIVNVDKYKLDYPVDIPPQARQFIECLVQKDPNLRPKCQDLLKFKLFSLYSVKNKGKKSL